ncbi:MAG: hypothetical protein ACI85J_001147 [Candidatus Poriferisodalaceae bacterium]|jgi:hypothetical protein|tara:strand:+ start:8248 stop:9390 length:1143 start_codon:yes stop_codon:yes gene_type:complete
MGDHNEEKQTNSRSASKSVALKKPALYISDLCQSHQVVLLGDQIGVTQHLDFLASLIPSLYEVGVTHLAWEFTNSRCQGVLDELLTAPEWEQNTCSEIFADLLGIGFSYSEYAAVLQAVWRFNKSLTDGVPFRVIALGLPSYVEDPDLLDGRSAAELQLRNWWMGGHYRDMTAFHMINVLTNEVLRHGQRVVVYANADQTTTNFIQWVDGLATTTLGNLLHRWMGEGVQRVLFHGAISEGALNKRVEDLIATSPEKPDNFGIKLDASTLGNVAVNELTGSYDGVETSFRLRDLANGYVYLAKVEDWQPSTLTENFLNSSNYVSVESRYRALDPQEDRYSMKELEAVRREGQERLNESWPSISQDDSEPVAPKKGFFRRRA